MGDYHTEAERCICRVPEALANGDAMRKLRTNRPKVWFEGSLPNMPLSELKRIFFDWANRWSRVCNVECLEASSRAEAHWIIVPARIDGKNGVLADMHLPPVPQQVMRLDVSENATEQQLGQTIMHEAGHGFGLLHLDSTPPPDVMEPQLNRSLMEPQATEAKIMATMYGPPRQTPTTPTSTGVLTCTLKVTDNGGSVSCEISAAKPGYSATLKGDKPWSAAIHAPVEQAEVWDTDSYGEEP